MAIKGTITKQNPANTSGGGRVDFRKSDYDRAIQEKGYRVIYRKAVQCPCKSKGSGNQSTCKNCGGVGWLWINPIETKMLLQSMNTNPKYQEYGEALMGTVNITSRDVDKLAKMDEITLMEGEAESTEVLFLYYNSTDNVYYTNTVYPIQQDYYIALYVSDSDPLSKLEKDTDYTLDGRRIIINQSVLSQFTDLTDLSITVRYLHKPKYYVWDIGRDVMNTTIKKGGSEHNIKMPLNAIGMRADLVKDLENYNNDRLHDNSFLTQCDVNNAKL